jgi:ubiquinone/menaquinone biosynthesis C-methylase UbiE
MTTPDQKKWDAYWNDKAAQSSSDFEYDHGRPLRKNVIEEMSDQELVSFIDPQPSEVVFDAGCGTGANIMLFHSKVSRVVAMDFNSGAVERCQKRMADNKIQNVQVMQGSITAIPLPDSSVDKIICMSVLQYLGDDDFAAAFKEFRRILKPGGMVVVHVKNLSSLYLSTLRAMKKVRSLWRHQTTIEYYRHFRWYIKTLGATGFEIADYNSFNWFMLEGMPRPMLSAIQKFEFEHHQAPLFNNKFIRRIGSDLKIKARALKG